MVEYLQEQPKAYEAVLQLGVATDTEDMTGTPVEEVDTVSVTEEQAASVLASFVGEIDQGPRFVLIGAMLVALMAIRPQGLLGKQRVEIV